MKLLSQTISGQVVYCPKKETYYLEFGTIFLSFSAQRLISFRNYLENINHHYFLEKNKTSFNRRKLLLHIRSEDVMFCVTESEFLELKELLSFKKNSLELKIEEFDNYHIMLN